MIESPAPSVARFRRGAGVVGGGVLLAGGRVLTCAHVVNAALGRPRDARERPRELVAVDFPLQGLHGGAATVVAWSPPIEFGQGDVALLELTGDPLTDQAPLALVDRAVASDEELAIFGFPRQHPEGVWKGELGHAGTLVGGWSQLIGRGMRTYKLQAGFSGCPVLDAAGQVVGIFAQAELADDVDAGAEIPTTVAVAAVQADGRSRFRSRNRGKQDASRRRQRLRRRGCDGRCRRSGTCRHCATATSRAATKSWPRWPTSWPPSTWSR
jgi:hypothetical protein